MTLDGVLEIPFDKRLIDWNALPEGLLASVGEAEFPETDREPEAVIDEPWDTCRFGWPLTGCTNVSRSQLRPSRASYIKPLLCFKDVNFNFQPCHLSWAMLGSTIIGVGTLRNDSTEICDAG